MMTLSEYFIICSCIFYHDTTSFKFPYWFDLEHENWEIDGNELKESAIF